MHLWVVIECPKVQNASLALDKVVWYLQCCWMGVLDETEWRYNAEEEEIIAFYLPASVMRDPEISCKAKVVWSYMNARPRGWDFSSHRIAKSMKESYQPIQRAMKELEGKGYLKRSRRPDGRFSYELVYSPAMMTEEEGKRCLKDVFPVAFCADEDFICVEEGIKRMMSELGLSRSEAAESCFDWQETCKEAKLPQSERTFQRWLDHVRSSL